MTVDARGQYDIILDRIIAALRNYSQQQSGIDPAVGFRAVPGSFRTIQPVKVPTIGVHLSSLRNANDTAQSVEWDLIATYNLDLIANGKSNGTTRGDAAAHARLMYLVQQVINAIYGGDARTTIEAGNVSLVWPTWQLAEPDSYQEEQPLIGGRMSIEARCSVVPRAAESTELSSLHLDATLWSGMYDFGGEE